MLRLFRVPLAFLVLLIALTGFYAPSAVPLNQRVLFIGNSFTSQNNLPLMYQKLANSGGIAVSFDQVTRAGWTLFQHSAAKDENGAISKIRNGHWDFVVLQEQSQYAAYQNLRTQMFEGVRILDQEIRKSHARTVVFMTWAYRNGDAMNSGVKETQTFESMQEQLKIGYMQISSERSAVLCPVGLAWLKAKMEKENIGLWASDNKHPSIEGTYLSACVFYGTLLKRSPVGLEFMAGLKPDQGHFLQRVASDVCAESL